MKRHLKIVILSSALTLVVTIVLLATTPALAASRGGRAEPASSSRIVALTHSYFAALNRGLATGDVSSLGAIIAPSATLTERTALVHGMPVTEAGTGIVHGRSMILRFYRHLSADLPGGHWIVGTQYQPSPTTMVVFARALGSQGTRPLSSVQQVTVRNGKITQLDLLLDYLL